jgi:hypothetical protein
MLSRLTLEKKLSGIFTNRVLLQRHVEEAMPACPENISAWLGRLKLLYGIPVNYLVPDEGMLPPESIRFFYLDDNWVDALVDGAYSIGRNLTVAQDTVSIAMDRASAPFIAKKTRAALAAIRPAALGIPQPVVNFSTVSGFLLRSSLVQAFPGMGVNPYPLGGTPDNKDPSKVVLLNILRMERLGPSSDTLLCLIDGDAYRVDIHEAPEALHYGLNSYGYSNNVITSQKTVYQFTKSGDPHNPSVTMNMQKPIDLNLATSDCFRAANDPRTIKMQTLANLIAAQQAPVLPSIDSAEMGFEMIEGVGMVSFYNKTSE